MSLAFPTIIVVVKYIIYIFILNDVSCFYIFIIFLCFIQTLTTDYIFGITPKYEKALVKPMNILIIGKNITTTYSRGLEVNEK